jgi:hypothetical protein
MAGKGPSIRRITALPSIGDIRRLVLTLGDAKPQQGKIYTAERSEIPSQQLVSYC